VTAPRPYASLSLDADDEWAYLRTHGEPAWQRHPSYLPRFLPRLYDVCDELGVTLTVFIVGFDAAREANLPALGELTRRGHEVGNHSFSHECCLHLYSAERIDEEVTSAEEAITAATGARPTGFRGPGFSWSPALLSVLERRGYRYDASTLPTILAPLARRYFLATATLTAEERERRAALFGTFRDGFRPLVPYRWALDGGRTLLEIPVTTIPGLRVPFHLSYLLFLARRSVALMNAYLHTAIFACRALDVAPSFLLHPLDFMGGDEVPGLGFFPGMDLSSRRKIELTKRVLRTLARHFELVSLGAHARRAERDVAVHTRRPTGAPVGRLQE
jgi:hypothetical protein